MEYFLPGIYIIDVCIVREKQMPLPACVYHAVRKTFDLHKEELKSYTFERC